MLALFVGTLLVSCASNDTIRRGEADVKKPINCSTAVGDIRTLRSEKTHVTEQVASGVTAIHPAGLVLNTVKGSEGTQVKVATGDYNKMLDKKIAEIQKTCGVK